jgi:DNA helicase-2/ATP-dependent DNA helicase PcrA
MSDPDFLKLLNPPQREAVTFGEGPLLVVAGAGSGKTRVLTYRIAYLVRSMGVQPGRILATTFTNKAAGEMKDRVRSLLGPAADELWVGTFHSMCTRILRKEIHHLGYKPGFVIYDEKDAEGVVREALRRCDLDEKIYTPNAMRWQIERAKNDARTPESIADAPDAFFSPNIIRVYDIYQRLLRENGAVDFGDLILLTVQLFERHPRVADWYRDRWQHILVDEYQDTNLAQYRLIRLLSGRTRNLCCVGDEDQNVYSWRGATIRNILDFEKDFPGARIVKLEQNYRSTNLILEAAGAVVARNRRRREKKLWSARSGGDPIVLHQARNEFEEARFVVGEVRRLRRSGLRAGDIAIFYRTNAQSRVLEECLLAENYAYTIVGGVRFYDRAEVKDLLAYLRAIYNPVDGMALRRIINSPSRGIGKVTVARAISLARESEIPFAEALRVVASDPETGSAARKKLTAFLELMDGLRDGGASALPSVLLQKLIDRTGYVRRLQDDDSPESRSRLENIEELVTSVYAFEENTPDATLGNYLDQISLVSDVDSLEEVPDRIVLMTVHSAKGLEFPVVMMVGMEESLFPHSLSQDDPDAIEEERRLCYVGMTRAKDHLYLCHAVSRRVFGSLRFNEPSRFFSEIPPDLISTRGSAWAMDPAAIGKTPGGVRARRGGGGKRSHGEGASGRVIDYSYDQSGDYGAGEYGDEREDSMSGLEAIDVAPGTSVRHPNLGLGTVERLEGEGRRARIVVRFQRGGVRTLMLAYAELEIV